MSEPEWKLHNELTHRTAIGCNVWTKGPLRKVCSNGIETVFRTLDDMSTCQQISALQSLYAEPRGEREASASFGRRPIQGAIGESEALMNEARQALSQVMPKINGILDNVLTITEVGAKYADAFGVFVSEKAKADAQSKELT